MSSGLAVATSDLFFCYYYMQFQLDIWGCLCFDFSGYSESVKRTNSISKDENSFYTCSLNTFLASCGRSLFFEQFPNPGLFRFSYVYPVGVWDEKLQRQKGRIHVCC